MEESHSGLLMPLESDTIAAKSLQEPQMSKVADAMVSKMLFLIIPINCLQTYSINLVDPTRKIEGVVKKLRGLADFVTLEQLTQHVKLILKSPNGEPIRLGY